MISALAIAGYWILLILGDNMPYLWPKIALPQFVFMCSAMLFCVLLVFPVVPVVLPFVVKMQATALLQKDAGKCSMILFVCPFIALSTITLGPGSPLCVLALILQVALVLYILSYSKLSEDGDIMTFVGVMWALFVRQYFVLSGHDYQLSSIHFDAGFVGFQEANFIGGGILVMVNTFCAPLLLSTALPLVVLFLKHPLSPVHMPCSTLLMYVKAEALEHLRRPLLTFIFMFAVDLASSMAFAFIARRHLMVWRLFCPKYLFEAVMTLVVQCFCMLAVLVFWRVLKAGGSRNKYAT